MVLGLWWAVAGGTAVHMPDSHGSFGLFVVFVAARNLWVQTKLRYVPCTHEIDWNSTCTGVKADCKWCENEPVIFNSFPDLAAGPLTRAMVLSKPRKSALQLRWGMVLLVEVARELRVPIENSRTVAFAGSNPKMPLEWSPTPVGRRRIVSDCGGIQRWFLLKLYQVWFWYGVTSDFDNGYVFSSRCRP